MGNGAPKTENLGMASTVQPNSDPYVARIHRTNVAGDNYRVVFPWVESSGRCVRSREDN